MLERGYRIQKIYEWVIKNITNLGEKDVLKKYNKDYARHLPRWIPNYHLKKIRIHENGEHPFPSVLNETATNNDYKEFVEDVCYVYNFTIEEVFDKE